MKRMVLFLWLLTLLPSVARVGGGESYSGGGSSYSSSSGGGGGDGFGLLFELLIRLIFYYPKIGIPVLIGVGLWFYFQYRAGAAGRAFSDLQKWSNANTVERQAKADLSILKRNDPNFSEPLFLDFISLLYGQALQGQGQNQDPLGAYLSPTLREQLESYSGPQTTSVLTGSMHINSILVDQATENVQVQFESNVARSNGDSLFVVDVANFQRRSGAKTPEPEAVYALSCPHCGDNTGVGPNGRCPSCGEVVNDGRFGWVMQSLSGASSTGRPPVVLSETGMEIGTELRTIKDPALMTQRHALVKRDPDFQPESFESLARQTFLLLQQAWTEMNWDAARALETDHLYQQHKYWMQTYQKQGVRNVLEEVEVTRIDWAKVSADKYFDSITVRIFARMKDYTIDLSTQKVVSGSPQQVRSFSEYWTFVRRAGVTSKDRDATRCPNCGAPLDQVNQVGDCEYCHTRITRGDFDWILSRIEQDEAYS